VSKLHLVDLAGSERAKETGTTGGVVCRAPLLRVSGGGGGQGDVRGRLLEPTIAGRQAASGGLGRQ
jgi:hypothetical protein